MEEGIADEPLDGIVFAFALPHASGSPQAISKAEPGESAGC